MVLLNDEQIVGACGLLSINYRKVAKAQLQAFVKWGNEHCYKKEHGEYPYLRHECPRCWAELEQDLK